MRDDTGTNQVDIRLKADRTLFLWPIGDAAPVQIGSASSALALDTWYRVGIHTNNTGATATVTAYLDGTSFASGNLNTSGANVRTDNARFGVVNTSTCEVFYDDIIINDNTGSRENGMPGDVKLAYLRPNAAGDNNGALSGDYTSIDETVPDDATTVAILDANNDILDVNVEAPSVYGIDPWDTIKFVAVGVREAATTAASESWQARIKSASGGTVSSSATTTHDDTTYKTNGDGAPRNYKLVSYTDPTTTAAWTVTGTNSLDNMQIGIIAIDATPDIQVTALWAVVAYVAETQPSPSQNTYRLYEDGTETASTAIAAQDTNITRNVTANSNLQLRDRLQQTTGAAGASTDDYQLQYSKNGGAWTNVTTSSTSVKGFDSASLTDGGATTNRLGAGGNELFGDNFNNTTRNTIKWTQFGTATVPSETGTVLQYATSTTAGYGGYTTIDQFNLTGSSMSIQVVDAGNQALASLEVNPIQVIKTADTNNKLFWLITGGNLRPYKKVSGVTTALATNLTFSATTHKYLRIRELSGTTYWEYSADRFTWTTHHSEANPITITSVYQETTVGTWAAEASGTNVQFDDFKVMADGSFIAGEISEDGLVDDLNLTLSNYTELLNSLTLISADLANNDTLDFRVLTNGVVAGSRTETLRPNAAGDAQTWAVTGASAHVATNDDLTTTYLRNNTASPFEADLNLDASALVVAEIVGIDVRFQARTETSAVGQVQVGVRLSSTNSLGTNVTAIPITETSFKSSDISRPGGGSWTVADLANLQVVAIGDNNSGTAVRVTELYVDVRYRTNPRITVSKPATTTTQTTTGKARITASTTQTITGKARITATASQTITGKARITTTVTQTQLGKARITAASTQTQTGKARVTASTTQTQTGKGRITASATRTQDGKARITATSTQTQTGRGRITQTAGNPYFVTQSSTVGSTEDYKGFGYSGNQRKIGKDSSGRLFITYRKYSSAVYQIFVDYSDNGSTWTSVRVADITTAHQRVSSLAIGSDDAVHVVWYGKDPSNTGTDQRQIKYAKSTDNGATYSSWVSVGGDVSGYASQTLWQEHPCVFVDSQNPNNLYVVWEGRDSVNTSSQHVKFSKSTDGGTTWSAWANIGTNGSRPGITKTGNGILHVVYYSSSGSPLNSAIQGQHIYSSDEGATWSSNTIIGDTGYDSRHQSLIRDNNSLHVAYRQIDVANSTSQIRYSMFDGSTWSAPVIISQSPGSVWQFFPHIGLIKGQPTVLWFETTDGATYPSEDPTTGNIYISRKYNGSWTIRQALATTDADLYPYINKDSLDLAYSTNTASPYSIKYLKLGEHGLGSQSGKARITNTATKTQGGKSRIQVATTSTQLGKARLTATSLQTQTGKSRIQITSTQTQTGKANIAGGVAQTQTGKARVTAATTQIQTGKANIFKTTTQTTTGVANIIPNDTLVDSYSESNVDENGALDITYSKEGQSFTGIGGTITRAKFYLKKSGTPAVNMVAKLYAHSGTFGASGSKPTGTALATSDTVSTTTLTASSQLITFNFTGAERYLMTNATKYFIILEATLTDDSVRIGIDYSSATHPGRGVTYDTDWLDYFDHAFYVYAIAITTQTQTGKARVTVSTTKTQSGIARVTASTVKTILGKARVTATATQTVTGKARITAIASQTQLGKARVAVLSTQTTTGKARITAATVQTQTGKARVSTTAIQTVTGKARIAKIVEQTITGKANIVISTVTTTKTTTGKARIASVATQTITGKASISSNVLPPATKTILVDGKYLAYRVTPQFYIRL
ncbi:MAG: exo-alpha-sialidase [Blastocatellia bacterium]|nr:exo-alpha-sialidase [Blastocatellia bacterium]